MIWQVQWERLMSNFLRHVYQLILHPQTQTQLKASCKSLQDVSTLNQRAILYMKIPYQMNNFLLRFSPKGVIDFHLIIYVYSFSSCWWQSPILYQVITEGMEYNVWSHRQRLLSTEWEETHTEGRFDPRLTNTMYLPTELIG